MFTVKQMRRLEEKLRNPKGYIALTERIKRELVLRERTKWVPTKTTSPGPEVIHEPILISSSPSNKKKNKKKKKKKEKKLNKSTKKKQNPVILCNI
jgi:hypothetical protein